MNFRFQNKRLAGVVTVVPRNEKSFLEEMKNFNFPEERSLKLKEVMGYDKRRLVKEGVCVSDLAVFGLEKMFEKGFLKPEEIDALLVISQSPDHLMPSTAGIIQGRLQLKRDLLCMDVAQACAGFVLGLMQAFMLLEQESIRKVVLVNGDVLSRKTSPKDRNIYPLVGDAIGISVIERDPEPSDIYASFKMDGSRYGALIIPAGGMRMPCTAETAVLQDAGDNNFRAKDHLYMDGSAIFNFVQTEIPPLIENLLATAGRTKESVDYFLCHQPNRFMLQKLADKMKIPYARMPNNVVEKFGNSSGATIPMALVLNVAEKAKSGALEVCLAGFGAGLTWAAMLLPLRRLAFCEMLEYP